MLGSRAIYHQGWKAVTFHPLFRMHGEERDPDAPFDDDVWELYHLAEDVSETRDLAEKEPERLAAMIDLWWREAERNDVLPLDNRPMAAILSPRHEARDRARYRYFPGGAPVPETVAANVRNRSHTITATVHVADGVTPNGVLLALGCVLGGFSLYLRDGSLSYVHNLYGKERHRIASDTIVGAGDHQLQFVFTKTVDFSGRGELFVDGTSVGSGDIPHFTPVRFSIAGSGLTCGYEVGPAIGDDYVAPFRCNVAIRDVVVEVAGVPHRDPDAEFEAIMSEQ
jgi:arylsulfatase